MGQVTVPTGKASIMSFHTAESGSIAVPAVANYSRPEQLASSNSTLSTGINKRKSVQCGANILDQLFTRDAGVRVEERNKPIITTVQKQRHSRRKAIVFRLS